MNPNTAKSQCRHCNRYITLSNLTKHEAACASNVMNQKTCPVCSRSFASKSITCSHSCANTHFRTGIKHPNWNPSSYRSTCFLHHQKACIICQESRIVEVHHFDGNNKNNAPSNLIPLCPTHHQYIHSRYKELIINRVIQYATQFEKTHPAH
jgi:hypothetical protein